MSNQVKKPGLVSPVIPRSFSQSQILLQLAVFSLYLAKSAFPCNYQVAYSGYHSYVFEIHFSVMFLKNIHSSCLLKVSLMKSSQP